MNSQQYAPVIIPTLNRYAHFRRCLESLERCTGADKTDVYIGLDYPPSDKYQEGWKMIDAYLKEKEKKNGFKRLFVRRRDHNCGVGVEMSNVSLLLQDVKPYGRYIFSEDDNEFSPNFLQYINKALTVYDNDDSVYCVCGYNRRIVLPDSFNSTCYLAYDYVAWGVGFWTHKNGPDKYRSFNTLMRLLRDDDSYSVLCKRAPESVKGIVSMLKRQRFHGDVLVNVYEAIEGKFSVMPVLSKVRNHGNDGTGIHSRKLVSHFNDYYSKQPIDEAEDIEFPDVVPFNPEGLKIIIPDYSLAKWKRFIRYIAYRIDLLLIRRLGLVIHRN